MGTQKLHVQLQTLSCPLFRCKSVLANPRMEFHVNLDLNKLASIDDVICAGQPLEVSRGNLMSLKIYTKVKSSGFDLCPCSEGTDIKRHGIHGRGHRAPRKFVGTAAPLSRRVLTDSLRVTFSTPPESLAPDRRPVGGRARDPKPAASSASYFVC
jgi:hypothetical protein